MKVKKQVEIEESSGNVFADLGFPDAQQMEAKAALVHQIDKIIQSHQWTQQEAAEALGIPQPKVSALLRGQLSGFSYERLIRFLNLLKCDVEITLKYRPLSRRQAKISVAV